MFKWALLPAVLVALLSASGCCCGPCGPFGHGLICKPGCGIDCRPCGPTCGPACGPSCGPACGPSCGAGSCGPSLTCSPCGGGIKYWLNGRCYHGRSCGERYWGEWVSDPPNCCDPCNQCADFVGPRCCGPGPLMRLWSAIVCHPCCHSCGGVGCDACGGGSYSAGYAPSHGGGCSTCGGGHGNIMNENWDHQSPPPVPGKMIHSAGQPTPARMTQRPQQVNTQVAQVRTNTYRGNVQQAGAQMRR